MTLVETFLFDLIFKNGLRSTSAGVTTVWLTVTISTSEFYFIPELQTAFTCQAVKLQLCNVKGLKSL